MHRSASVAIALLVAMRGEVGQEGLARVFGEVVKKRTVMRPTFWPLLESREFEELCLKLRSTVSKSQQTIALAAAVVVASRSKRELEFF